MSKRGTIELIHLKPIIYKIKDIVSDSLNHPKYLIEYGVTVILGHLFACKEFTPYLTDGFRMHLLHAIEMLQDINKKYITAKVPGEYTPSKQEVKAIEKEIELLLGEENALHRNDFMHGYFHCLRHIEEGMEVGSPSLDDAYSLFGIVSAFDLINECHREEAFRKLVHHLNVYADSWPAKFALTDVRESLSLLLNERRRFAA